MRNKWIKNLRSPKRKKKESLSHTKIMCPFLCYSARGCVMVTKLLWEGLHYPEILLIYGLMFLLNNGESCPEAHPSLLFGCHIEPTSNEVRVVARYHLRVMTSITGRQEKRPDNHFSLKHLLSMHQSLSLGAPCVQASLSTWGSGLQMFEVKPSFI